MNGYSRTAVSLVLILFILILLSSCSYGFLNFSSETGNIELSFGFTNTNALGVDKLVYKLSPPAGADLSVTISNTRDFDYHYIDRADIGFWHITGELYSGDIFIQQFDYDVEVVTENTTKLEINAEYTAGGYDIRFETWQYGDSGMDSTGGTSDSYFFTVSEMRLMPAVYKAYRSGDYRYSVNLRVLGTGLVDNVRGIRLSYPDGAVYEYGELYINNRKIDLYDVADNNMLEFNRPFLYEDNLLNGDYKLKLTDNNSASDIFEKTLDLDFESLMPSITSTGIPSSFTISDSYDFYYDFGSAGGNGTMLVFFVNQVTNEINPPDDSMAVSSSSGFISLTPALLNTGGWELIIAAIEHSTSTPYTDATALGLSPDLSSGTLPGSIYDLYGEDSGYIMYTGAAFQVTP